MYFINRIYCNDIDRFLRYLKKKVVCNHTLDNIFKNHRDRKRRNGSIVSPNRYLLMISKLTINLDNSQLNLKIIIAFLKIMNIYSLHKRSKDQSCVIYCKLR